MRVKTSLERHNYQPLTEKRLREVIQLIRDMREGKISEKVYDNSLTDDEYRNAMMMMQLRDYKL